MALVPCPECHKEVSTQALACPQCAFPFPGKQGLSEGSQSNKLCPCPDCGFLVSKQARSCPHCGVLKVEEQKPQSSNGNLSEETWLCPHCGTSYTRKVSKEAEQVTDNQSIPAVPAQSTGAALLQSSVHKQEAVPTIDLGNILEEPLSSTRDRIKLEEMPTPPRQRSPLWQDTSLPMERDQRVVSRRYPRSRRKSIVVGLIIVVLVAASIAFGALWQMQGVNPLEALVYWRM